MSWDYKNVLASPAEHSKNPISNSDTGADGNCPMSDTNHPKGPSTGSGPREYEVPPSSSASSSFLKEVPSKTSAPMSNLVESTRQQHDRNFFQKFLRFPAADGRRFPKDFGHNGFDSNEPCSSTSQQIQPLDQANQFMPQANQSTPLRSSSYSMAPVNFTFGLSHHFEGDTSRDPTENLMMPFYNADDLAGNSMQVYSDMSSISLFNSLNNQSGAIDGSNVHPSCSGNNQSRDRFEARREELGALGKSYSSVLHPVPSAEAAALHMRRQTPNQLSLLEMEQRLSIGNCDFLLERSDIQSMLKPSSENQQNQLTDEPFRTLSQFNPNQRVPTSLPYQVAHPHAKPIKLTGHSNFGKRSSMSDNSGTLSQLETSVVGSQMHETASGRGFIHSASGSGMGSAVRRRNKSPFFNNNYLGQGQPGYKLDAHGTGVVNSEESERFSRKVFVGGLPPDIDEEEIKASFRRFGALLVDWPHKAESKSYFPPKGYAFLLFQDESSVQSLIDSCFQEEDKLYLCVSSPTIKDKPVQIRPWRLSDSDFVLDSTLTLDPRKTVFVGGVPRPLKASELATIMNNKYGGVCYAGIDTDPELKYPKGAGRVAFSNYQSYIAAISARYVHIHHSEIEKRVEVKPYVLDDQFCDECQGSKCNNKFAPFFCANITCLRYYCDSCWSTVHSQPGREYHKPLVKEGGDRPRAAQSFKW